MPCHTVVQVRHDVKRRVTLVGVCAAFRRYLNPNIHYDAMIAACSDCSS
jgi:hypothetical protein